MAGKILVGSLDRNWVIGKFLKLMHCGIVNKREWLEFNGPAYICDG